MLYKNTKIDLTEYEQEGMESIHLAQNRDQGQIQQSQKWKFGFCEMQVITQKRAIQIISWLDKNLKQKRLQDLRAKIYH
jgi:hypothetical protein